MENQLHNFSVNGVKLHYIKSGNGQPVLFIPGSISDYRTWSGIFPYFEKSHQCFVFSRRFQYPDKFIPNGDSSVAANTDDIAQFIREQQLAPVVLVGHSFGGFVALNVAMKYPDLVKSVIAEEPIFAPALVKNPKNPLELFGLMFRNFKAGKNFVRLGMKGIEPTFKSLAKGDTEFAQRAFIDGVTDGKKTPETLDELTRVQLADNIEALAGEDPFNNQIKMSDVAGIKCEVLLMNGSKSPFAFQYINLQLKRMIPHSQTITFANAGHWIHIDEPKKFVSAMSDFLK